MKSGCLSAVVFAVVGLIGFALLAPILFRGADMGQLGRIAALPIILVCGLVGFAFGLARSKKNPS